jgi:hypothetical protein
MMDGRSATSGWRRLDLLGVRGCVSDSRLRSSEDPWRVGVRAKYTPKPFVRTEKRDHVSMHRGHLGLAERVRGRHRLRPESYPVPGHTTRLPDRRDTKAKLLS